MDWARNAFLKEAGIGLCHQYASVDDPLFTELGFQEHVDDALTRMVNPFLRDPVDRVTRDPVRKIGWDDRLLGSMRLACKAGVEPLLLAKGAGIALRYACEENKWDSAEAGLEEVWKEVQCEDKNELHKLIITNF
jgi:mannitol-1-phosphate 5-dehydrogenase